MVKQGTAAPPAFCCNVLVLSGNLSHSLNRVLTGCRGCCCRKVLLSEGRVHREANTLECAYHGEQAAASTV